MPENDRPNIIIVLSDQLRRQALACYGDPNISTPHIDELAERGVTFRNACSTYPICVPFRFSMMTGEYAHTRMVPGIEWRMSPTERTLADEFNEAGYETVYVGKWHLYGGHLHMPGYSAAHVGRTPVPREYQGRWEKWFGFELRNAPFDTYYYLDDDPTPIPIEGYQTDGLFNLAMDYLTEGRDTSRPFCCVISVEPPHPPSEAPEELEKKWTDRDIELPPNFRTETEEQSKQWLHWRRIYYAMTENLDENVGRLTQFLEQRGLKDNTIVMFVSDHGELLGSHGVIGKQHPYEESVGIPLIVTDPSVPQRAGTWVDDPVNTEDLFPTILGLAGLTPRNPLCGADLTPLIRGEIEALPREGVLLEFVSELRKHMPYHEKTWRAVRTRRYKYLVLGDIHGAEPWQFFDLHADPHELNNLLEDPAHAGEVQRHHGLLRGLLVETGDHYVLKPAFGMDGLNEWQP